MTQPTYMVDQLKRLMPGVGRRRIANFLAHAGLHISASTAERRAAMPAARPTPEPVDASSDGNDHDAEVQAATPPASPRRVTARATNHTWHVDLTLLPTGLGWWVPWLPLSVTQCWPFCFWLAVVLDHHSRAIVAWQLSRSQPSAKEVCEVLEAGRRRFGTGPKYIISDSGAQFGNLYRAWCAERSVKPRFGAIGQHGSIAVIERFFRSLKTEMLRKLPIVPLAMTGCGQRSRPT